MSKFRKKPIVIEATQWPPGPVPQGFKGIEGVWCGDSGRLYLVTLEGTMEITPGDWIITGVQGEKYPCKPDIFDATYDPVEDDNNE